MALYYEWNKKVIFRCGKRIFATLYDIILGVIDEHEIIFTNNLEKLIKKLELGLYDMDCDLADYIKTKAQMNEFTELLEKAICQYYIEVPLLCQEVKDLLWNFHNELVKCGESLPE